MPLFNTPPSCQTVSGIYIEPCSPDPVDILIHDVAHCLSNGGRWAGNCNDLTPERNPIHYSVGQHSCLVHDIIVMLFGAKAAFYALMHDASEAYLVDIPTPIKGLLGNYYEIEERLMAVILAKFNVPVDDDIRAKVKQIDFNILFWERDALMGKPDQPYGIEDKHPGGTMFDHIPNFRPWTNRRTKAEFLHRFMLHTEFRQEVGDEAFEQHLRQITHDNINLPMGGLAHLDQKWAA